MTKRGVRFAALMLVIISQCLYASIESVTDERSLLGGVFPEQCHFSGHFTQQKNVEGLPVPLKSEGDFFYSCDLGLIWHTRSPFEETILYVNSTNNYRIEEDGSLSPLTGVTRYIMSHVFVRVLRADADYFVDEFAISRKQDNETVELKPESEFMKKGLQSIRIRKVEDAKADVSLMVSVLDATGQVTDVNIDHIKAYNIEGKRRAFEQCEQLYADNRQWCQILRSPVHAERL